MNNYLILVKKLEALVASKYFLTVAVQINYSWLSLIRIPRGENFCSDYREIRIVESLSYSNFQTWRVKIRIREINREFWKIRKNTKGIFKSTIHFKGEGGGQCKSVRLSFLWCHSTVQFFCKVKSLFLYKDATNRNIFCSVYVWTISVQRYSLAHTFGFCIPFIISVKIFFLIFFSMLKVYLAEYQMIEKLLY